jgi:hypothetical protein
MNDLQLMKRVFAIHDATKLWAFVLELKRRKKLSIYNAAKQRLILMGYDEDGARCSPTRLVSETTEDPRDDDLHPVRKSKPGVRRITPRAITTEESDA